MGSCGEIYFVQAVDNKLQFQIKQLLCEYSHSLCTLLPRMEIVIKWKYHGGKYVIKMATASIEELFAADPTQVESVIRGQQERTILEDSKTQYL